MAITKHRGKKTRENLDYFRQPIKFSLKTVSPGPGEARAVSFLQKFPVVSQWC